MRALLQERYVRRRSGWRALKLVSDTWERTTAVIERIATPARAVLAGSRKNRIAAPAAGPTAEPLRPRILVCDEAIPAPDRDSGGHRMDAILRLMAPLSGRLTFLPRQPSRHRAYSASLRDAGVEVLHPVPMSAARFLQRRAGFYDVVLLSRLDVANRLLPAVRRWQPDALVIFDTVDLFSLRFSREHAVRGGTRGADAARASALESRAVEASDVTAAVTGVEADLIGRLHPRARTLVMPNVHDVRSGRIPGFASRAGLLFVGSFLHSPNVDGLEWFLEEVLPHICREIDARLTVVGADPPPSLVRRYRASVDFSGWVADIAPCFDAARVFVAPLRFGAGMKGKLGQALAQGLPSVTTTIGAEGMDLEDGLHVLVRDDPAAFAAAVVDAYNDNALWTRLSRGGRAVVRERWSSDVMRRRIVALLDTVAPPASRQAGQSRQEA